MRRRAAAEREAASDEGATAAVSAAELRDLGIHRIPVPIPFPQAGGPANVYAIEEAGGGVLLFDAGLGTPEAEAALEAGLRRAGHRFSDVRRIVISHGHVDHYGAARTVVERHGGEVPVYAHPADIPKVAEEGPRWPDLVPVYAAFFERLGVPADVVAAGLAGVARGFEMARRVPRVLPVQAGERVRLAHVSLEVLHMPGHTPGVLCLYDREHRLVFSADHLLEKISPNPLIDLAPDGTQRIRPLLAYLESIGRLQALELDSVLPGHAEPFRGHRRVIDGLAQFLARRQARVRGALESGPLTCHAVSRILFPWATELDLFLTISETLANLEVLEARGEVRRDLDSGVWRFTLVT